MATNPITTEDLTINFSDLMKIPVGDRVQAAMLSPDYENALINSLTPIQMAKAFPDYYRRDLPDISNFVLGNRYLDDKGAAAFNQKGGGDYGEDKPLYDGKRKTSPPPKTVVDTILESAKIYETTGQTGVTSAIKDTDEDKIMSTADVSLSPQERALLDTLAIGNPNEKGVWESPSYNTIVGGKKFESFADHPRVFGLGNSSAAGRYQFTKTTWDLVVDKYNKENPDSRITDFSPLNQDRAALWLAKSDYKRRTGGRDLMEDLNNPPENFGELIKAGLGGGSFAGLKQTDTTWEILQKRNAFEIEEAFDENLKRNSEFAKQEIEAAAKQDTGIKVSVTPEVSEILSSNPETKKYFLEDNPDVGVKLQEQINAGILSIDDLKNKIRSNTQTINNLADMVNEYGYSLPVTGTMMHEGHGQTSEFGYGRGRLHAGVDIYSTDPETGKLRVGSNAPVTAPMEGKVTMIMKDRGRAGNYIEIQDKNGNKHRFLHTAENPAINPTTGETWKVGETINQGETVTYITGSGTKFDDKVKELDGDINAAVNYFDQTGWGSVNKPHLHYEVRNNEGQLLDPATIFPQYSGQNKKEITFSNKDDKLKHSLVTGQLSKEDYEKQKSNDSQVLNKEKKPLSIISYSRPEESIKKESAAVVSTQEKEVPTYQYGGKPETQDDENLSVYDDTGSLRFKMNSGEGIYVKPEANEYADSKIDELSNRLDDVSNSFNANQPQQNRPKSDARHPWADKVVAADRPRSPSADRANRRTKFLNEGWRAGGWGSPNSITS